MHKAPSGRIAGRIVVDELSWACGTSATRGSKRTEDRRIEVRRLPYRARPRASSQLPKRALVGKTLVHGQGRRNDESSIAIRRGRTAWRLAPASRSARSDRLVHSYLWN